MPPKSKKSAPLFKPRRGEGDKNRSRPQPLPEFQTIQELSSQDERSYLMEVKKTLGTMTSALAAITTQVDNLSLTHDRALQAATLSAQPGTRTGESPTAAPTAFFDPSMEEHQSRSSNPPFLAIIDDETDGKEEVVLPRKSQTTLGKLRSADTSAIH